MTGKMLCVLLAVCAAMLPGCTNTTIIYNYGDMGKPGMDTVYVLKPPSYIRMPPGTPGPGPGGPTIPVPPDTSGSSQVIPDRWSSIQPLIPGTAKVETIISTADSLVIYRVLGNVLNGRLSAIPEEQSRSFELDPEMWRNTVTGVIDLYLTVRFQSRDGWTGIEGSPDVLQIEVDGSRIARFTLGRAEEVLPVRLPAGGYAVSIRFATTRDVMESLAKAWRTTATLYERGVPYRSDCSEDNTQNFQTFFDDFVLGGGTKAGAGLEPGMPTRPGPSARI